MKNDLHYKKKDEYYTPKILVELIIKYIKKDSIVWCPFDTDDSEFVLSMKEHNITVIHSHIWEGKDFFEYEPSNYDVIISNPPLSKKLEVIYFE